MDEKLKEFLQQERQKAIDAMPELVRDCPYDVRLAITEWVFKNICEHARGDGSFRYLIYNRLGFDLDAYSPLYYAGGMDISNEFSLPGKGRYKVIFSFSIGDKVDIKAITRPGEVDAMMNSINGQEFRVVYWNDGQRYSIWMYPTEIELREET